MHRNHIALRALFVAAATLLSTGAWAQHTQGKATDKVEKAGERIDKGAQKVGAKAETGAKGAKEAVEPSKVKTAEERAARKVKEHEAQREKLMVTWKGPVNEGLRQELRRHAERLARLARIKDIAETEKDKESAEKADKLITKEKERHDKWIGKHATTPMKSGSTPAPAGEKKEGVK